MYVHQKTHISFGSKNRSKHASDLLQYHLKSKRYDSISPFVSEGSSKKDFKEFPVPVQKNMGVSLFVVQLGDTPDSVKPWKGLGRRTR